MAPTQTDPNINSMDNSIGIGIWFVLVQHYELIVEESKNEYSELVIKCVQN